MCLVRRRSLPILHTFLILDALVVKSAQNSLLVTLLSRDLPLRRISSCESET